MENESGQENAPYTRVADDSPDRCQAVTSDGQCKLIKASGHDFCIVHGGAGISAEKRQSLKNYQIAKFHYRLTQLANSSGLKSLRDEVAILRMTLEEHMNRFQTSNDLLMHTHIISDLVMKISSVVERCHKLESATGYLLDKTALLNFAQQIIGIISEECTEDQARNIANKILQQLGDTSC